MAAPPKNAKRRPDVRPWRREFATAIFVSAAFQYVITSGLVQTDAARSRKLFAQGRSDADRQTPLLD